MIIQKKPTPAAKAAGRDFQTEVILQFEGVPFPVVFRNCPDVLSGLSRVLHGWPSRLVDPAEISADRAHIEISQDRRGYRTRLTWVEDELRNASVAATVCNLTVDFIEGLIGDNRDLLCLHCGAALLDGRLVIFTGPGRAGKSTLVGRLAAAGVTVFSDDLLLLVGPEDHGHSFGIRGRLRLPLPEGSSDAFRRFVDDHAGPRDTRYLYLDTPQFADFGTAAPIGAVVILDRAPVAGAHLAAAGRSEALQHLIKRNVARDAPADAIVDRLNRVMEQALCLRLEYSDLEDAVSLIVGTFGTWPAEGATPSAVLPAPQPLPARRKKRSVPVPRDLRYRRHPDVTVREVEGALFLASVEGQAIWHLNALGTGVWNLLAEPQSPAEVVQMLLVAFPEADSRQIADDVDELFAGLAASGLVTAVPVATRAARPKAPEAGHQESGAPCGSMRRP